jgi:hypothetical protein
MPLIGRPAALQPLAGQWQASEGVGDPFWQDRSPGGTGTVRQIGIYPVIESGQHGPYGEVLPHEKYAHTLVRYGRHYMVQTGADSEYVENRTIRTMWS